MGIRIEYSILEGDDTTGEWHEVGYGTSGTQPSADTAVTIIATDIRNGDTVRGLIPAGLPSTE